MHVLPASRRLIFTVALALLIGAVLVIAPAVVATSTVQQPSATATAGPTLTATADPVKIITGGDEAANIWSLLQRFGIPIGGGAVLLMFSFVVLRAVGKKNLDRLSERLNVVDPLFRPIDRWRHRRSLDAGSLSYLKWLEGQYGRLQPLGIGTTNVDLDLDKVYVPLHTLEQNEIEGYYRRMRGDLSASADEPSDVFDKFTRRDGEREELQIFSLLSDPALLPPPKPDPEPGARLQRCPRTRSQRPSPRPGCCCLAMPAAARRRRSATRRSSWPRRTVPASVRPFARGSGCI